MKTIVLILFAAWSALCWSWYVCSIKEACDRLAPTDTREVITPPLEPDTPAVQAYNTQREPFSAGTIDRVQFEELEDRMVIHFPYNSTRKEDDAAIDEYLSTLAQHLISTGSTVRIDGHADFVGDYKYNLNLGQRRVNGIRDILVRKGVPKTQIKTYSYGDRKPLATNDTAKGRYLNRRVEIKVSK